MNYTFDVSLNQLAVAVGSMLRLQMEKFGNGKRWLPIWEEEFVLVKVKLRCWWVGL